MPTHTFSFDSDPADDMRPEWHARRVGDLDVHVAVLLPPRCDRRTREAEVHRAVREAVRGGEKSIAS